MSTAIAPRSLAISSISKKPAVVDELVYFAFAGVVGSRLLSLIASAFDAASRHTQSVFGVATVGAVHAALLAASNLKSEYAQGAYHTRAEFAIAARMLRTRRTCNVTAVVEASIVSVSRGERERSDRMYPSPAWGTRECKRNETTCFRIRP